ncbi:hypothetical protein [Veiled chameleon serpentovirus A]|uniref:Uncharacterized protein n=1 Tax=Veiled chameleon serpentovirus A TaxID=2806429 RepID=A0AAE7TSR6_9NIDO|nr:hypothetical protein QKS92_gp08 [Veiled chameleon serpentovirus A]QRC47052.1 hypothetical protein [Veiled chameleon serpentovirus A]
MVAGTILVTKHQMPSTRRSTHFPKSSSNLQGPIPTIISTNSSVTTETQYLPCPILLTTTKISGTKQSLLVWPTCPKKWLQPSDLEQECSQQTGRNLCFISNGFPSKCKTTENSESIRAPSKTMTNRKLPSVPCHGKSSSNTRLTGTVRPISWIPLVILLVNLFHTCWAVPRHESHQTILPQGDGSAREGLPSRRLLAALADSNLAEVDRPKRIQFENGKQVFSTYNRPQPCFMQLSEDCEISYSSYLLTIMITNLVNIIIFCLLSHFGVYDKLMHFAITRLSHLKYKMVSSAK